MRARWVMSCLAALAAASALAAPLPDLPRDEQQRLEGTWVIRQIDWILLMPPPVTGRSLSPSKTGSRPWPVPAWEFQPVLVAPATTMRDQGGPSPTRA
jgi:hypothetical protein